MGEHANTSRKNAPGRRRLDRALVATLVTTDLDARGAPGRSGTRQRPVGGGPEQQQTLAFTDEAWEALQVGQVVEGIVCRVEPFGAFVRITGGEAGSDAIGVRGLLHRSNISRSFVADASERLSLGDRVVALVAGKEEDAQGRRRLQLSTAELEKELAGKPQQTRSDVLRGVQQERGSNSFKAGQLVKGVVHKVFPHGVVVDVDGNSGAGDKSRAPVSGYLHVADISRQYVFCAADHFKEGDEVAAVVMAGNPHGSSLRISTRRLERTAGEMLTNRAAVYQHAEETLAAQAALIVTGRDVDEPGAEPVPEDVWALAPPGSLVAGVVESVQPSGVVLRVELSSDRLLQDLWAQGPDHQGTVEPVLASLPGLLRTTHISALRLESADMVFKPGDLVCAVVAEQQREAGRLVLSTRELEGYKGAILLDSSAVMCTAVFKCSRSTEDQGTPFTFAAERSPPPQRVKVGLLVYGIVQGVTDTVAYLDLMDRDWPLGVLYVGNFSKLTAVPLQGSGSSEDVVSVGAASGPKYSLRDHLRVGELVMAQVVRLRGQRGAGGSAVLATSSLEGKPGDMLRDRKELFQSWQHVYSRLAGRLDSAVDSLWTKLLDYDWSDNMQTLPSVAVMQHWLNVYYAKRGGLPEPVSSLVVAQPPHHGGGGGSAIDGEAGISDAEAAARHASSRQGEHWLRLVKLIVEMSEAGCIFDYRHAGAVSSDDLWQLFNRPVESEPQKDPDAQAELSEGDTSPTFEDMLHEYFVGLAKLPDTEPLPRDQLLTLEVVLTSPEAALLRAEVAHPDGGDKVLAYGVLHASDLTRAHVGTLDAGSADGCDGPKGEGSTCYGGLLPRVDRVLSPGDKVRAVRTIGGYKFKHELARLLTSELELEPGDMLRDPAGVFASAEEVYETRVRPARDVKAALMPVVEEVLRLPRQSSGSVARHGRGYPDGPSLLAMIDWLTDSPARALQAWPLLTRLMEGSGSWEETAQRVIELGAPEVAAFKATAQELTKGSVHRGIVKRVEPYGVLVQLLIGPTGLIRPGAISKARVEDVGAVFKAGDEVTCMVTDTNLRTGRICLSTQDLERKSGDMLRDPKLVYARAQETAREWLAKK